MKSWLLGFAVFGLYVLHQDIWFWETARPLVFGFLPVGLFYHAVYSIVVAMLMIVLVNFAWPTALEREVESDSSDLTEGPL
jgi:hypothetical protein